MDSVQDDSAKILVEEFTSLSEEFKSLKQLHKSYTEIMRQVFALQSKCNKELAHQNYRLSTISTYLNYCEKEDLAQSPELKKSASDLRENISQRKEELKYVSNCLPRKNTSYLQACLGSVNLSMLNVNEKWKYKEDYENFKFTVHIISMFLSILNVIVESNFLAMLFKFLLVWYYCTLTLRESILSLNGSRIRGWFRFHHFVFITLSGFLLLWPETNPIYVKHFRSQLLLFSVYMSFVHYLQFKYQKEVMYRIRALGQGHNMDITVEGFHSFMFRGLGFLLPFHLVLYIFELYNAKVLWTLWSTHPDATWHLPVISSLFFIIFLGNLVTLLKAIPRKFRERMNLKGKFEVALDTMKKASSTASLSVAVEKIRKLSAATSLANLSILLNSDFSGLKTGNPDSGDDQNNQIDQDFDVQVDNDEDDDIIFIMDSKKDENAKDKDKSDRYPLKKFLHLSHRIV